MMVVKKKVLITVKTYPTPSTNYIELVCTAGIQEDGTWVRIYPLPFRLLENDSKFSKYNWIEIELEKHSSDKRPESYRPCNIDKIKVLEKIGTGEKRDWKERRDIILDRCKIFNDIEKLITKAKNDELSLAVFKPSKINTFKFKKEEVEWDQEKLKKIKAKLAQRNLFDEASFDHYFKIMPKLPYKFSYEFEDIYGKKCNLMISDWEIGQLYWNYL